MSRFASLIGSNAAGAVVAGGVALGGAALYFKDTILGPQDAPAAPEQLMAAPEEAAPVRSPEAAASAPAEATAGTVPAFDVVRVEADGQSLIAGSAEPGATVRIVVDGAVIAEAVAGADGAFVAFAEVPQSDVPQAMRLLSDAGESEGTVIVAPQAAAEEAAPREEPAQMARVEAEPLADVVADPVAAETEAPQQDIAAAAKEEEAPEAETQVTEVEAPVTEGEEPKPVLAEAQEPPVKVEDSEEPKPVVTAAQEAALEPEPEAPAKATAPAVLLADDSGVKVLQSAAPEALTSVALDVISYDAEGEVSLAGRAPDSGFVRVYLNNKPVTTQPVDTTGNWKADLPEVDTGVYELRVDQVSESGKVTSRVTTPFKREDPKHVKAVPEAVRVVTVERGATLWAIAQKRYGDGLLYVQVFEANKERIKDPDLIYPGQIFEMPVRAGE